MADSAGDRRDGIATLDSATVTRTRTPPAARAALATLATLGGLLITASWALPARAAAQAARVDLGVVFLHAGVVAGSVSGASGAAGDAHTGSGWSVGGGLSVGRSQAFVANYTTFGFRDAGAPASATMNQTEAGARVRIGGVHTPIVFYVEGGGAKRSTSLTSARVFGNSPPSDAGQMVDVDGWAGWFGPGLQVYFHRRVAGEINVAWAWGRMDRAHIQGNTVTLDSPVNVTTLRLRCGLAATLF